MASEMENGGLKTILRDVDIGRRRKTERAPDRDLTTMWRGAGRVRLRNDESIPGRQRSSGAPQSQGKKMLPKLPKLWSRERGRTGPGGGGSDAKGRGEITNRLTGFFWHKSGENVPLRPKRSYLGTKKLPPLRLVEMGRRQPDRGADLFGV